MVPLIINEAVRTAIAEVVEYAKVNPLDLEFMKAEVAKIENGLPFSPVGDDLRRRVLIPMGFCCVFSIEQQPDGWSRHISISAVEFLAIGPMVLSVLLAEFGMENDLSKCYAYVQEFDGRKALNVIALEPGGKQPLPADLENTSHSR